MYGHGHRDDCSSLFGSATLLNSAHCRDNVPGRGLLAQLVLISHYCKFINVCEGFIWRISRPSLNRKNKYPVDIIYVPR